MTSVAKIGTAMGQMIMPPLIAFLIISFGWRTATFYLGIAASIGLVLAASIITHQKLRERRPIDAKTSFELLDKKVFSL